MSCFGVAKRCWSKNSYFKLERSLRKWKNKIVIRLMKNELDEKIMEVFATLRQKEISH